MKLSTKALVVVPLFLVAGAASEYLNYHYQAKQTREQAQDAATAQAMIIRESLVNMMINNQRVDDDYLARINRVSDVQNLHILFTVDNLHLRPELLTSERIERLKQREQRERGEHTGRGLEVFSTGQSLWETHDQHLEAVIPFKAEAKCQRCHYVSMNHVLGAAHMEISLSKAYAALQENAKRSMWIFIIFAIVAIVIDAVIFWKFVSKPVQKLVRATEVLGTGNLDYRVEVQNPNDELGKLAISFNEMQERLKQAQMELIHKERLSMVGQMASSIIHDFRSPMGAIQLAFQMLQKRTNISEKERDEIYSLVRTSIERMSRMTKELLDFSRGETKLEICDCDVGEFVNNLTVGVKMHLENRGIRFHVEQRYHGKAVFDPDRLQRALINIINNAEDAMIKGGEIRFETLREDNNLVFRISDTGGGIPEEIRDKVFAPFVTSGKAKGTGLGLAITKKVVEQHGGEISFQSERGKGTTFIIKIPLKVPNEHSS